METDSILMKLFKQRLILGLFSLSLVLPQAGFAGGPPPIITVQPSSQTVSMNDTVIFTVTATSGTMLSYQWYRNGVIIPFAIFGAHMIPFAQTNDQAVYSVKVTNGGGSVMSSNATLTVVVSPPVITTQPRAQTANAGQNVTFSVSCTGSFPFRYQWICNGTPLTGRTNATLTLNAVQSADCGYYTVTVANSAGSAHSEPAMLVVSNPPISIATDGGSTMGMTPAGFSFGLSLPLGATFVIEATSNSRDWTPIATNVAVTSNVVFTDPDAVKHPTRFYRVMVR